MYLSPATESHNAAFSRQSPRNERKLARERPRGKRIFFWHLFVDYYYLRDGKDAYYLHETNVIFAKKETSSGKSQLLLCICAVAFIPCFLHFVRFASVRFGRKEIQIIIRRQKRNRTKNELLRFARAPWRPSFFVFRTETRTHRQF